MRLLRSSPAGTPHDPTATSGALALAPEELVALVELVEITDEPAPDVGLEQAVDDAEHLVIDLDREVRGLTARETDARSDEALVALAGAARTRRCRSCSPSTARSPGGRPGRTSWSAPTARTSSRRA